MSDRDSIIAFIEARAAKYRKQGESGMGQSALARRAATLLEALASDIMNQLDIDDAD